MTETLADTLAATDRLLTVCRRIGEAEARRIAAAFALAPSPLIAKALLAGRRVPREALDPVFANRLVCWDGVLDDDIALDVEVLLAADRAAGDMPAIAWQPRAARAS